ncbi:MAG: GDSL family lipase [Ferruginibacter sp.]|nr:GDSL family lipase [Rhodoferax sp.]
MKPAHPTVAHYSRRLKALTALLVLAGAVHKASAEVPLFATSLASSTPSSAGGLLPSAPLLTPQTRWQSSLDAFDKADHDRLPANDGVLFVGSSTIRMWTSLSDDFRQVPVIINRGFGGSTMADCNYFVRELVIRYKPKQVLVYAGDNDLSEGRSPADVRDSFAKFVRSVRAELPEARISYISIKPSPLRLELLPKIRQTNTLIADYVHTVKDVRYIDIFQPMLDAEGQPRPELFLPDRLHLNDAGYRLWKSIITAQLPASAPTQTPAGQIAGIH